MGSSKLDADLIRAYRAAVYRINDAFGASIDHYSAELDAWQQHNGHASSALITAFNPAGRLCSGGFNRKANQQLEDLIVKSGHFYCAAVGLDPLNRWPPEPGFLIGGIEYAAAESLAMAFDQNAWIWSDLEAVPRLQLLR